MEPTTIYSLPDEILIQIFTSFDRYTRRQALTRLSLVSRRFSEISQPIFYSSVEINTNIGINRFLVGKALEKYEIRRLVIRDGWMDVRAETVWRVLSTVKGVRELRISWYKKVHHSFIFDRDWLGFEGLKGIIKLELDGIYFHTTPSSLPKLPWSITHLHLPPPVIAPHNPFSFFAVPTLTHLELYEIPTTNITDFILFFETIAPNLFILYMERDVPDWLIPSFAHFGKLQRLTVLGLDIEGVMLAGVLETLPTKLPLEYLELRIQYPYTQTTSFFQALLNALSRSSLKSLRKLKLQMMARRQLETEVVGKEVLKKLEEMKVEVEWQWTEEEMRKADEEPDDEESDDDW